MSRRAETHFGYQRVASEDKDGLVSGLFDSVAARYDLMNDLMSLGMHRLWKRMAVERAALRPGQSVLDLASGTGDLARLMRPMLGAEGRLVLADFSSAMLRRGRNRLVDAGLAHGMHWVLADAQRLPFADASFDRITLAFGLRNVTDQARALAQMRRVLRPGGRLVVLEFSQPADEWLARLYDMYSFAWLPMLGEWVAGDAASYRYLVESIRRHPGQRQLLQMFVDAGFADCHYSDINGGIVAVHCGCAPS